MCYFYNFVNLYWFYVGTAGSNLKCVGIIEFHNVWGWYVIKARAKHLTIVEFTDLIYRYFTCMNENLITVARKKILLDLHFVLKQNGLNIIIQILITKITDIWV
jgi:hypothetical protein